MKSSRALDKKTLQRMIWTLGVLIGLSLVCQFQSLQSATIPHERRNSVNELHPRENITAQELERLLKRHIDALRLVRIQPNVETHSVKVFCWVNTYDKNHNRAKAIRDTWGQFCDKLLFMSNVQDPELPSVKIDAPATHEALWKKHKGVLRLIYKEYYDQYDWFFKCDDDTFVLMENLKLLLQRREYADVVKTKPLILGHRMTLQPWELQRPFNPLHQAPPDQLKVMLQVMKETRPKGGLLYTPGGSGYALNWQYIKLLTESLDEPYCLPTMEVPDDWAISFCMSHHNVYPVDTRDDQTRERFHQYSPARLFHEPYDESDYDHDVYPSIYYLNNWFSDHNGLGWQNGKMCCAPDSVSFHYIKGRMMHLLFYYYYGEGQKKDELLLNKTQQLS